MIDFCCCEINPFLFENFFGGQNYLTYFIIFIEPVEVAKQKPVVKPDAEVVQEKPVEKVTLKKNWEIKKIRVITLLKTYFNLFRIVDMLKMKQRITLRCIVLTAISSPE